MKALKIVLVISLAGAFAAPVFAQEAAHVGTALAPLALARYDNGRQTVNCSSSNYKTQRCPVRWRDADLVRQTSDSACQRGRSWGIDRHGIWVSNGCAGVFAEAGRGYRPGPVGPGGWAPGADWNRAITLSCGSPQYNYNMCQVDTGRGSNVRLQRQTSNTRCIEGRNWGWNRAGIWVDKGCGGVFVIDRRWR